MTDKTKESQKQAVLVATANMQGQFNAAKTNWENVQQYAILEIQKAAHYPSAYISVPAAETDKTRTLAQSNNQKVKIERIIDVSKYDGLKEIYVAFLQDAGKPHDISMLTLRDSDARKFDAELVKIGFYLAWNKSGRQPQFAAAAVPFRKSKGQKVEKII